MGKLLMQMFLTILLFHLCNCECNSKVRKSSKLNSMPPNNEIDCENDENVLLSRKKRALTFPPGSSLQLGMWIFHTLY